MLIVIAVWTAGGCGRAEAPVIGLRYEENQSMEYHEVIGAYQKLADYYRQGALFEMGGTDVGRPLHLFMISGDGDFDPASVRRKGRAIVLVNNGIHAGEPQKV